MAFRKIFSRDTGDRDLSSLAAGLLAGSVLFQSKNGWNVLDFLNVQFDVTGTNHNIFPGSGLLLPFAPRVGGVSGKGFLTLVNTGQTYRIAIPYTGGVTAYGIPSEATLNGAMMWPMNRPMPPEAGWPGVVV